MLRTKLFLLRVLLPKLPVRFVCLTVIQMNDHQKNCLAGDSLLKNWIWSEPTVTLDKNFGSGYPSDETCVKWLFEF